MKTASEEEKHLREWISAWRRAGPALERLREEELRHLSEAESARIFDGLDSPFPPVLSASSGLVEQQRFFRKLHPRPAA